MADETVPIRRTKRCGNCTWFDGESRCYLNPPVPLAVTPVVVRDRANIKKHYERHLQEVAEGPFEDRTTSPVRIWASGLIASLRS